MTVRSHDLDRHGQLERRLVLEARLALLFPDAAHVGLSDDVRWRRVRTPGARIEPGPGLAGRLPLDLEPDDHLRELRPGPANAKRIASPSPRYVITSCTWRNLLVSQLPGAAGAKSHAHAIRLT